MGLYTKKERKRGRPDRVSTLENKLREAVLTGDEAVIQNYEKAVKYMIDVLGMPDASCQSKMSAAKWLIERANSVVNEFTEDEPEVVATALEAKEQDEIDQLISKTAISPTSSKMQ